MQVERGAFYQPEEISKAVQKKIKNAKDKGEGIDYLSFVPDGEPALDSNLGREIALLKTSGFKIAVITNASLVWQKSVRDDLCEADWVSLKIDAVRDVVQKHGFDAVIFSICRDKQPIMNKEQMWEQKKKMGKVSDRLQVDPVFNLQTDFGVASSCTRINPILHWDEIAIWEYTQEMEIPVNPLYFAKDGVRYRSLGCQPCTSPIKSSAKNTAEIVEELKVAKGPEETKRTQEEKDKEEIMQKLKDMGYM